MKFHDQEIVIMPKAIAFCRRLMDMQDMSLGDKKVMLSSWMKTGWFIRWIRIVIPEVLVH